MGKVKLTDICSPKQWKTIPTEQLTEDGYPVYGANGIIGKYSEYNHANPVIAITCRGATCGNINITQEKAYVTGNAMCLDDLCSDVDLEYLFYALRHYDFSTVISGSAQPQITRQGLSKVSIQLFPFDQQKFIAKTLTKAERIISHRRTQLAKLDELIKCRFVEMFGVIIPDNTYVKLGDVCDIERGGSPRPIANYITNEDNGINWIKIGDTTTDRYIRSAAEKIRPEGARKSRFVYEGDLLLSNSMSFGHPFILKINGCIHDGWLVLHFEKSILNTIYLQSYLSMPEVYNIFSNMAVGGVVNNLNKDMVKKLPILVPPMSLQEKFETFVRRIDKLRF